MDEIMLLERGLGLQNRVWPDLKARAALLALSGALYVMSGLQGRPFFNARASHPML